MKGVKRALRIRVRIRTKKVLRISNSESKNVTVCNWTVPVRIRQVQHFYCTLSYYFLLLCYYSINYFQLFLLCTQYSKILNMILKTRKPAVIVHNAYTVFNLQCNCYLLLELQLTVL
jgi:hypothetical protein